MKKALLIAIPLAVAAGCGTKTVYVETATTPAPAPSTSLYVPSDSYLSAREELFLDFIRSQVGPLWGTERTVIELGYTICDSLRSGMNFYDLEDAVAESLEPELIAAVIISAVYNLCPDQQYKAEAYANSSGV